MKDDCYEKKEKNRAYTLMFYVILLLASLTATAAIALSYFGFDSASYALFVLSIVLFAVIYGQATRYYNPMDKLREGGHGLLSRYVRFLHKHHIPIVFIAAQVIIPIAVLTEPDRTPGVTIATIVFMEVVVILTLIWIKKQKKNKEQS